MLNACLAYHDHLIRVPQFWQWFVAHGIDPFVNHAFASKILLLCGSV